MLAKSLLLFSLACLPMVVYAEESIPTELPAASPELMALREAIIAEDDAKVTSLLDANPSFLEAQDEDGNTPLLFAIEANSKQMIELILSRGADITHRRLTGATVLVYAAFMNVDLQIITLFIDKGADVNATSKAGHTALTNATYYGNDELAEFLIEKGADVNAVTENGGTALMNAASRASTEVVKLLIEKGANVNAVSDIGETPLTAAVYDKGKLETVKLLIHHGADVKFADSNGWSVLHNATYAGQLEIIQILVEKGADVNGVGSMDEDKGYTPLINAADGGNLEVVKFLLEKGADITHKTDDGKTALDIAKEKGHKEIADYLQNYKP